MQNNTNKKMYIKLFYSLLDWEWYSDTNTLRVFLHLLLIANRKEHPYCGDTIRRGEALAAISYLAEELNLSIRSVRTAINHLKSTGEVTTRKINKTTVYSLTNYNRYQQCDKTSDIETTTKRQRNDNETTTLRECNNEENERLRDCVAEKHTHGKLKNVLLSTDEYNRFKNDYPDTAEMIIDQLSSKIATNPKKYKDSHLGHLYVFAANFKPKQKNGHQPSYDVELAIQRSLNLDPAKTKRTQEQAKQ